MFYQTELELLRNTFKKCHIQTLLINNREQLDRRIDVGLLRLIGKDESFENYFLPILSKVKSNTIYKYTDTFGRRYMMLALPDITDRITLVIGPYVPRTFSRSEILENAEKMGAAPQLIAPLVNYFGSIPTLTEESHLFALLDCFAELIWRGAENFTVALLGKEILDAPIINTSSKTIADPEKTAWNMQLMEERYRYENELMQAVTNGQIHKTELMLSSVSSISFEKRLTDPLREIKNYSIIMNTLLRKAAENGGVHPIYLDSISSEFAIKIEKLSSVQAVENLMNEMFRSYCRLVKNHSSKQYSPIVQKIITIVDYDLTANLSLNALAGMLNINASYLSSRFKKETGETLTDYVNQKRIKQAKRLLKTTNLQIQTVAQYCGILDLHYFSKLFKKHTGLTPKEYRENTDVIG